MRGRQQLSKQTQRSCPHNKGLFVLIFFLGGWGHHVDRTPPGEGYAIARRTMISNTLNQGRCEYARRMKKECPEYALPLPYPPMYNSQNPNRITGTGRYVGIASTQPGKSHCCSRMLGSGTIIIAHIWWPCGPTMVPLKQCRYQHSARQHK